MGEEAEAMKQHMNYNITTTPITPTLTKLEYFAGLVMAQISHGEYPEDAARIAVEYAKALVAECDKAQGANP